MMSRKYVKREGPWIPSVPLVYNHKLPIANIEKYWKGLDEGRVFATKCTACGTVYYPPQIDCPSCRSQQMEWVELPKEGVIDTFTKIYARPQGYEDFEPYIVAIVHTGGLRIMGWLKAKDERCVKVGDRVVIRTEKVEKHNKHIIVFELTDKIC
ncbi:putative nucleic-acid-binding protein containing a Zn-ribbon [Pyrobaculum oguniense TE7]|uniref:Nucleic-acid-binding protein containing a Zn-ribbon n=1 Tax=Pyrobaculum oguniense (strain DSM 13380 / JCM 10595 / TE7) TaxID=698757 RepID=H6Q8Z5_PYROT|nr:putative nucleic-acid-binding protein containing a Zn-ribbon [Pyrobaculum oguniense TE7]